MRKLTIPIALMLLTLNACSPGSSIEPDPDPSDSTTFPIPECAYTFKYVITSERVWQGGYHNGKGGWINVSSTQGLTDFTYTDSIWGAVGGAGVFSPRIEMSRKLYDTLPMNVNVKIYYDDILVKDVSKTLKNPSNEDPYSSYLTVYGGHIWVCR